MSNGNKPAVICGHNVGLAEVALGIQQDLGHRTFTPVAFRVGRHENKAGEGIGTLKLLLWATNRGINIYMTLDQLLPRFAEYWDETGRGVRAPSYSGHPNLYELWRLWKARPSTLVSDVFELHARPISLKVALAAGTQLTNTDTNTHLGPVEITSDTVLTGRLSGCDSISVRLTGGLSRFLDIL